VTVFTYAENGQTFAVAPSAGAPVNTGALVITTAGAVQVSGGLTNGAATFTGIVSLETTTTAGIVVKTTAALRIAHTSLAAVVTLGGAVTRAITVQFPVVGANGVVYYLYGSVSA